MAVKSKIQIGEPIVSITNLKKVFRIGSEKVIALNNVSLEIKKGEICCLLGTSGSGKSTLLNMMAGLEKPTKGEVIICNEHVEKMSEKQLADFRQKYFGFVFQSYNLLGQLTALENVSLPLIFKGWNNKKRNKKSIETLEAVGLSDRKHHKPTQMSGGQQQRVGIARAFVSNPEIVFADEPTGNLDTKTTYEVMDKMVNMTKEKHKTLIIVTHDQEVADYADRIIKIRDGYVESIEIVNQEEKRILRQQFLEDELRRHSELAVADESPPLASDEVISEDHINSEEQSKDINVDDISTEEQNKDISVDDIYTEEQNKDISVDDIYSEQKNKVIDEEVKII